ncbi:MAG: glycosyltransferase [Chthoniobacterales bacterium]|nr:glycosyltransferase [Chthoniobacterales bacterium]
MRVLASPAFQNRADNPYNFALATALQVEGVEVCEFSWRRLLFERWDVAHVHWPEGALNTHGALRASARSLYLLLKLLYLKARGAQLVWTVHNLESHDQRFPKLERWFWKAYLPLVDTAIHLSRSGMTLALQAFPSLPAKGNSVIPLGHYRDLYENTSDRIAARTHLGLELHRPVVGFIGQIRLYKNIPALVRAFLTGLPQGASLILGGIPASSAVVSELLALTRSYPNILCRLERIPDCEIQFYLNACDLIVLPYTDVLNSSSALLALSFNRPVLVPALGAMTELREIAGQEWVHTYTGELTPALLREALHWAVATTRPAVCDLRAFQWSDIGRKTVSAYQGRLPSLTNKALLPSTI